MSCKNIFDRYCLEHDIAIASSNTLSSQKFHNEPEKTVMAYELLQASIERLNQVCERMGLTVGDLMAKYEQARLQHEMNRMALIKNRNEQNKEIAKIVAISRAKHKAKSMAHA